MQGGLARYPQTPSPSSQAVGAALLQRRSGVAPTAGPTPAGPMPMGDQGYAPGQTPAFGGPAAPGDAGAVDTSAAMRAQGAFQMSGAGQIDDAAADTGAHSANAINVAVGEALTRMGGGNQINQDPNKPHEANIRQLMHLGLSQVEAQLLVQTGGA